VTEKLILHTSVHERNSHTSSERLRDYLFWLFIPSCLWGLMAALNSLWEFWSLCKYAEAIFNIRHGVIVKREEAIPHTGDKKHTKWHSELNSERVTFLSFVNSGW